DWVAVTDGSNIDWHISWSPDGNLLYFLSHRDGFFCIWAQRLNPTSKQPTGAPFAIQHFHHAYQSLARLDRGDIIGMSVARGTMAFALRELTGNIWLHQTDEKTVSFFSVFKNAFAF